MRWVFALPLVSIQVLGIRRIMGRQIVSVRRSARLSKTKAERPVCQARRTTSAPLTSLTAASSRGRKGVPAKIPSRTQGSRVKGGTVRVVDSALASSASNKSNAARRTRESRINKEGDRMVIGVDEAGRGPFAGPVVAAACFIPAGVNIPGIKDSKKISQHSDRELLYRELVESPGVLWATSQVESRRIDEINILEATKEAMASCALRLCSQKPAGTRPYILVDGNFVPPGLSDDADVDSECVIGGDGSEYCIAAASIVAKVTRDRLMIEYGRRWPVFGFEKHKGYGTRAHHEALREHGMVEIHRRSFLKKMEAAEGKLKDYRG